MKRGILGMKCICVSFCIDKDIYEYELALYVFSVFSTSTNATFLVILTIQIFSYPVCLLIIMYMYTYFIGIYDMVSSLYAKTSIRYTCWSCSFVREQTVRLKFSK